MVVHLLDDAAEHPISSTAIRRMLDEGRVEEAAHLLGHFYELTGIVVEGDRRGRSIGFPTANLAVDDRMQIPAHGVYAAWVEVHEKVNPAVVNVGVRPTFGGTRLAVEAHLLDFDGDLYGRSLAVRFVARLRGERRFGSIDELATQIASDVAAGRRALEVPG
jgi:riboflavin kinase/FMN adenylyltransferase